MTLFQFMKFTVDFLRHDFEAFLRMTCTDLIQFYEGTEIEQ